MDGAVPYQNHDEEGGDDRVGLAGVGGAHARPAASNTAVSKNLAALLTADFTRPDP